MISDALHFGTENFEGEISISHYCCDGKEFHGNVKCVKIETTVYAHLLPLQLSSAIWHYDDDGSVLSVSYLDEKGELINDYFFMMDEAGKIMEINCYDHEMRRIASLYNLFDENGLVVLKYCLDEYEQLLWKEELIYNELGEIESRNMLNLKTAGTMSYFNFKYLDKKVTEYKVVPVGTSQLLDHELFAFTIQQEYNLMGDKMKTTETSPSGSATIYNFDYQYDDFGNWTACIVTNAQTNQTHFTYKRTIQYDDE